MNKSVFDNLPELEKDQCLEILRTPLVKLNLASDYYKAVYHLSKFPGKETEEILLSLIQQKSEDQAVIIAIRKAIEILAEFKCNKSVELIAQLLNADDKYIVENSVAALAKLKCNDIKLIEKITKLLDSDKYNKRVLIKSLTLMKTKIHLSRLKLIQDDNKLDSDVRGAAIASIFAISGDKSRFKVLIDNLSTGNQNQRICAIQDIVDAKADDLILSILNSPLPLSFRLKAFESLITQNIFLNNTYYWLKKLDYLIEDNTDNMNLDLDNYLNLTTNNLLERLFSPNFLIAYSAQKALLKIKKDDLCIKLLQYLPLAQRDYGAIYFFLYLIRNINNYNNKQEKELIKFTESALGKNWPSNIKFKPSAILTLFKLKIDLPQYIVRDLLSEKETPFWPSRYATLMAIDNCPNNNKYDEFLKNSKINQDDSSLFVRTKFIDIYKRLK
tara:strand:+ start:3444 stop:4772 length:1329 start_codon:yes stop_codon:yes gene_type:complete